VNNRSNICNKSDWYKKNQALICLIFAILFFSIQNTSAQSPAIVANGPLSFCYGGRVTLSVSNPPAGVSFQWLNNLAEMPGETNNQLIATQTGLYQVVLDDGNSKDTLNGVQVNVNRPDANLNGNGATVINGDRYFKVCAANAQNFTFTNASLTIATNTRYVIRWGDGSADFNATTFNAPISHLYGVGIKTLTFIVYSGSCVDSAQYKIFVGNIPAGGLVGVGGSTICSGNVQQFVIAGTTNNPPGTMYIMTYNDGSKKDTFYHPAPDTVSHIFPKTSCGTNSSNGTNSFPNSYGAFLSIVNPCGTAGGSILPIYVSDKPKAEISVSPNDTTCVNQITTIKNTTKDTRNVENGVCSTIKFVWRIKALSAGGAWTITSGSLGNDFGSGDPNLWVAGTLNLGVRFTAIGTYSVKLLMINNTLCGADSIEKTICVNPQPTASFTTNTQTGCAPLNVSASATTNTPLCGENTFNWSVIYTPTTGCSPSVSSFQYVNGTSATSQNPQIVFNNPGVYRLRLITNAPKGSCTSTATELQITVKGKPVLNINTPATICQGVRFRPTATASCYTTGASYAWLLNGATPNQFNQLLADNVEYTASGAYTIRLSATNECGTTDSTKSIQVRPEPVVTAPNNRQACHNTTVPAITLTGTPTGTTFTWTNSNVSIGLAASGNGNIPSFTATNNGTTPEVANITITPSANGCTGKPVVFTITVNPLPDVPVVSNVTYCQNDPSGPLNATALSGNNVYWYTTATGGTPSTSAPTPSTSTPGTTTYYVSQYNPVTNCESPRASLSVLVNPILNLNNRALTLCSNAPLNFTHPSAPSGTTYTWTVASVPASVQGANAGNTQSAVKDTLINTSTVTQSVSYSVTPIAAGCPGIPFILTITLQPRPAISDKSVTLCTGNLYEWFGENSVDGDLVPAGTLYSWPAPISNPSGAATGSSSSGTPRTKITQTLNNTTDQTATLTYTLSAISGACASDSFRITVNVNPKPVIPTQNISVCSRNPFILSPSTNLPSTIVPAGTKYIWTAPVVSPSGNVTGVTAETVPQSEISQTPVNTTTGTALVVYTVTPVSAAGVCTGEPFEVRVLVNPQPGIQDQMAEVCSGGIFSVIPQGTPVNTIYIWSNPVSIPAGAVTGGSAQSIPQLAISQQLQNQTNLPATVEYTVLPATGVCSSTSFKVNVTVFPRPVVLDTSLVLCSGGSFSFQPVNNQPATIIPQNTTYTWSQPVITPAGAITGAGSAGTPQAGINQTLVNLTNAPATVTYTITPKSGASGECIGNPFKITVTVNPDAKAAISATTNQGCAPFLIDQTVISNSSPATASNDFRWYANGQIIGTTRAFPGTTISNVNDSVLIKLVAVNQFGCLDDSTSQWFYTRPLPASSFNISADSICGPATISFVNTSPQHPSFRYEWNFGNGQTATSYQPAAVSFQPAASFGDTTYTITLRVWNECQSTTFTRSLFVRSLPNASFIPNRYTGCSPVQVIFLNRSAGLNTTYRWNFGDGSPWLDMPNKDSVVHLYSTGAVTTYTITLVASNHCGNDTTTLPITIRPNTISLEVETDGTRTKGCAPLTLQFVNKSSGSNSYKWDFGDGTIDFRTIGKEIVTHTFLNSGTYDVRMYSSNGCSDTSVYVARVEVYEKPVASFVADKYAVCLGDSIRFTNQSINASSYVWSFGNGTRSPLINPSFAYNTKGIYTVALSAAKTYGPGIVCYDTARASVIVNDTLPVTIRVNNDQGNCAPFTVQFDQDITPFASIEWNFGDGIVSSLPKPSHTYQLNGVYTVRVIVRTTGGCTYTGSRIITVAGPTGSLQYSGGYRCKNNSVQFTPTANNTDIIEWNFGDGTIVTTTPQTVFHTYTKAGTYVPVVRYKNNSGCVFTLPAGDTIRVDLMSPGFTQVKQELCGYTDIRFTDTTRSLFGISTVRWFPGDGSTKNGNAVVHRYTSTGTYEVKMVAQGISGCTDTATINLPVFVKSIPSAEITGGFNACTITPVSFDASVQSVDSINFYKWQLSNGALSSNKTFNYVFSTEGTYQVTLIAGTKYNCYDTTQKTYTVLRAPIMQASSDAVLCKTQSLSLSASGAVTYTWYPSEGLSCTVCAAPVARPQTTTNYVVKGTGANGCVVYDTVNISVIQPINVNTSGPDSICIGNSTQIFAFGADKYLWSPAIGLNNTTLSNPTATPSTTTRYRVVGSDNYNCFTDTAFVEVAVGQPLIVKLGQDLTASTGTQLPLKSNITNGPVKIWEWTPATDLSCNRCPEPVATIKNNITYVVNAVSAYGCTATDTIQIKAFCENAQVFVPNGFTPDGDGINDLLMVRATGVRKVKLFRIFNRWGELVFERYNFTPNDPAFGWDGTQRGAPAIPSVFVYTLEVECENGTLFTYKGNITLIK